MPYIRSVFLDCLFRDQSGVAFFKALLLSLQFPLMKLSLVHFYGQNARCRMPHLLQRAKVFHCLTGSELLDDSLGWQAPCCCSQH